MIQLRGYMKILESTLIHIYVCLRGCVQLPCWSGVDGISTGSGSAHVTSVWPSKIASVVKFPNTQYSLSELPSSGCLGMMMSTWRRVEGEEVGSLEEQRQEERADMENSALRCRHTQFWDIYRSSHSSRSLILVTMFTCHLKRDCRLNPTVTGRLKCM